MPKVSVIIPNYNHAPYLRQRIDTVLQQTFQDIEVILVDDCSTDESRSIISEYATDPRVTIEFNERNSGSVFKQWNKGVALSRGEYVWIAESDDYADLRLLERLVAVLDEESKVVFAYCHSWRVHDGGRLEGSVEFYTSGPDRYRWAVDHTADGREECRNYLVHNNTVPNASAVVFRRALYERIGGADESLRLCGDWKMWAAMALEGRIAYLSEPLNFFRCHDASMRNESKRLGLEVPEFLQVMRWISERVTPTESMRGKLCERVCEIWVPAMMSLRVPFAVKRAMLRDARAIDAQALQRAVRPALVILRLKFMKHWRQVLSTFANIRENYEF